MNEIIIFTKFFRQPPEDLAHLGQTIAVDGFDLCVRPGYLVNPENIQETLLPAVKTLAAAGLKVPMLTGSLDLTDPASPAAIPILQSMDQAGVRLLKLGYFPFDPRTQDYWQEIDKARYSLAGWEKLAKSYQVKVCYHTHSRGFLGVNCAALMHLIDGFDPQFIGAFIDPVHLVIEGEEFPLGAAMTQPYLSIASIKDVILRRVELDGHSSVELEVVPCGTGMVDFDSVFSTLRRINFQGPLTVHCEFEQATPAELSSLAQHEVIFAKRCRQHYFSS
jgi:sugar phosphate isomerase/epimerase